MDILPRFIRHKNAPGYLGIDRNKFDAEVRPFLTTIPLGTRSIAFDRLELDAWADEFKRLHGRPGHLMSRPPPLDFNMAPAAPPSIGKKYSASAPTMPAPEKRGPRKVVGTLEERHAALLAHLAEIRSRPKRKK